ncbi:MAG: MFS transporter [Actinobacteria bacterium]|nr:MFS transporter [Actinomycetota bacterium]
MRRGAGGGESGGDIAGFSRNVFILGLVSFCNDLSSEMVYPLFPTFLTEFLGAGAWFLGLVEGLADSVASLLNLFSGWWSDRLRRRKGLVTGGYAFSALSRGSLALAAAPWQALIGWFCNRVGKGLRTAPRDALIADSCDPAARGRAFGYHRSMDHSGALLGAAAASLLVTAFSLGYRTIFALAMLPVFLGILLLAWQVREAESPACADGQAAGELVKETAGEQPAAPLRLSLRPFDRRFKWLLAAVFLFTLGNSSDAFLLLRARRAGGFPLALLPALWGVLHVVKATVSIPGGRLSDRLGRKRVIVAGWSIYVLAYCGFAFLTGAGWIWLLFVVYGFYYLTEGVLKAYVADVVPTRQRGSAYGIFNFVISVTVLPASLLMGLLWDTVGARPAFLVGAGLALVAMLVLSVAPRGGAGCDARA